MANRQQTADEDAESEEAEEPRGPECPECGGTNFSESGGDLTCNECGLVIEESQIQESAEWRAFTEEEREKKARAGKPLTYTQHDMGVSTEIGKGGELFKVSGRKRGQYYRMRKWHRRATKSKDRNLGF
ncbi:MAG: TFIIB-type zinc ribbon-containing protein, partial [Candidatus Nanohaloarchaea archaeon]